MLCSKLQIENKNMTRMWIKNSKNDGLAPLNLAKCLERNGNYNFWLKYNKHYNRYYTFFFFGTTITYILLKEYLPNYEHEIFTCTYVICKEYIRNVPFRICHNEYHYNSMKS